MTRLIRRIVSNPILYMQLRRRLRKKHVIATAVVTGVLSAFIFLIVYLIATERELTDPWHAARIAFLPLFILQGFILMFLGTGAVAGGIAEERAAGRLEYHRMTPAASSGKLLGYLFGLPAREYWMFAVTLPFTAVCVIVGRMSLFGVAQLYVVFGCSVILYHLAGFASGIVASQPKKATNIARTIIVVIYLVLPALSELGFSFLGYFTVVPTFEGLIQQEIAITDSEVRLAFLSAEEWRLVPFYGMRIGPTLYTLCMQSVLIVAFCGLVARKWRRDANHGFSKRFALGIYAVLQFLVVGSLWGFVSGELDTIKLAAGSRALPAAVQLFAVLCAYFALCGSVALLLIHICCPTLDTHARHWRRAQKRGLGKIPRWEDGASGGLFSVVLSSLTVVAYFALMVRASATFGAAIFPQSILLWAFPCVLFIATVFYLQGGREYFRGKWYWGFLGLIWVVPGLLALIWVAAWGEWTVAAFVGHTNPVFAITFGVASISSELEAALAGPHGIDQLQAMLGVSIATSTGLAVLLQLGSARRRVALRQRGQTSPSR